MQNYADSLPHKKATDYYKLNANINMDNAIKESVNFPR